jgi:hypothetical protein
MPPESSSERFCSTCGLSLLPLDRPHVARQCTKCGKTVHVTEPGEGGKGIQVRAGDRFIIPAGFLKLSLDPGAGGRLFRHGVAFLVKQMVYAGMPESKDDLPKLLKHYKDTADAILTNSELLRGLDLETQSGADKAFEILHGKQDTREWHALLLGAFGEMVADAIPSGDAEKAAWAMYNAATAHAMTVVTESIFEQTLWRGYLANQVVYEAASAASQTPGEAEAIRELQPLFQRLDEATLHTWVESGLPIGPRIGVRSLPEPIVLALAKFHLAGFQRKREDERRAADEKRFVRELRVKWTSVGVAAGGAVAAALKALGIL